MCQVGWAALLSPALSWNPAPLSPAGAGRSPPTGKPDPDTSGPREGSRGWAPRGDVAVAGGRRHSRLVGVPMQQGPLGAGALRPRAHGTSHHLRGLLEGGKEGFPRGACTERQGDGGAPAALPVQEPSLRGQSCGPAAGLLPIPVPTLGWPCPSVSTGPSCPKSPSRPPHPRAQSPEPRQHSPVGPSSLL